MRSAGGSQLQLEALESGLATFQEVLFYRDLEVKALRFELVEVQEVIACLSTQLSTTKGVHN